jgi:hypothetical protein
LLNWDGFLTAAAIDPTDTKSAEESLAQFWLPVLKSETGGAWVIGVLLGLYTHGPCVAPNGPTVPVDLSRLRVSDPRVNEFLNSAETLWSNALSTGSALETAKKVVPLLATFRSDLGPAADVMLQDFDQVVAEILLPDADDDPTESLLLEADRLEEEVGPSAVIELLRDLFASKPKLRQRYIDALARAEEWEKIRSVLGPLALESLTRSELEHGIFAFSKVEPLESAVTMLKHYVDRYTDNAAKLYARELRQRNPGLHLPALGEQK